MKSKGWLVETLLKTVAMGLGIIFAIWIMRDVPPVEMSSMRLVGGWVLNEPLREFIIQTEGHKNRLCPVTVRESLIDSQGDEHVLPVRPGVVDSIGDFSTPIKYRLPPEPIPSGLTTFHSKAIYTPDYLQFCFKTWTITSPQRPDVRFWIGSGPPPWAKR